MAKFYLIDESLRDLGGHHAEYAHCVLRAAKRAGFQPVVATHCDFRDDFPDAWQVHNLYEHRIYDDRLLMPERHVADRFAGYLPWALEFAERWHRFKHGRRRRKMIRASVAATRRLFESAPLEAGDQVFWATASKLGLMSLVEYLKSAPAVDGVDWHVQFHFNFLLGREPDYEHQKSRQRPLQHAADAAAKLCPDHRLHFYTTTDELTAQYGRLFGGEPAVHTLPFPIKRSLRTCGRQERRAGPLRVVYAGDARIEKGYHQLPEIVRRLWPDYVETGKIEFVVQSNFAFKLPCRRRNRPLVDARSNLEKLPPERITLLREALSGEEYRQLVLSADVGLVPYDREHYYPRCSGVVVEMLCAAIPIVVPAGCWMAEQIAEPIFRHRWSLKKRLPVLDSYSLPDVRSRRFVLSEARSAESENCVTFGRGLRAACFQLPVPDGATHLFASFRLKKPAGRGRYVRLHVEQIGRGGRSVAQNSTILGHRNGPEGPIALVPLDEGADFILLVLRNAYDRGLITVEDVSIEFVSAAAEPHGKCPTGAVGLIADGPQQMARSVAEIAEHYRHYRDTARSFSVSWTDWHNPDRVVAELLDRRQSAPKADPASSPQRYLEKAG